MSKYAAQLSYRHAAEQLTTVVVQKLLCTVVVVAHLQNIYSSLCTLPVLTIIETCHDQQILEIQNDLSTLAL